MSKSDKVMSEYERAAFDLAPPYGFYAGRDTSMYALTDFDESRTSQEFADEADINNIMARYLKTGTVPVYADRQAFYADAHTMSYQEMQNILIDAENAFMQLPAAVRERFGNDPAAFVEFASDKKNVNELREMELLSPEAVQRLDAAKAAEDAAKASDLAKAAAKPPGEPSKPD